MNLFSFFKKNTTSAPVARERLQVLLAHERTIVGGGESDLVASRSRRLSQPCVRPHDKPDRRLRCAACDP
ncbi:MAG: cell division topological specificity factor MinE [Microvirga sp.]|nr:cell division topological specificity factor MinE [Microvirga sp.]